MARRLLVVALFALAGCDSISYLDPSGPGKTHTIGGPCPIPYRVLDIPVPNSSARIYVNAFDVGPLREPPALFVVVSDSRVFISHLVYSDAPQQKHTHEVSFPDGKRIQLTGRDGQSVSGELVTVSDGAGGTKAAMFKFALPVKFALPDGQWESFTVSFPTIYVDGQRMAIGSVSFKPGRVTIYINC